MRVCKLHSFHTLEEDILRIWKQHGWRVVKESVKNNSWLIEAEYLGVSEKDDVEIDNKQSRGRDKNLSIPDKAESENIAEKEI